MQEAEIAWELAQQTVKRQLGMGDYEELHTLLGKIAEALEPDA